jgi:hypothetical protein
MVIHAMAHADGRSLDWRYLKRLYRREGLTFIPRSMVAPLIANTVVGCSLFGTFAVVQDLFMSSSHFGMSTVGQQGPLMSSSQRTTFNPLVPVLAGGIAGCVQSLVSSPVDALKLRFKLSDLVHGKYRNAFDYAYQSLRSTAGLRQAYRGLFITATKDSFGFALFFGLFEDGKEWLSHIVRQSLSNQPTCQYSEPFLLSSSVIASGMLASAVYQTWAYPFDIVRHYMIRRSVSDGVVITYPSVLRSFKRRVQEEGWRKTFYRGFSLNIGRSLLPTALALLVFDMTSTSSTTMHRT